jgi:hypothetical protein
LKHLVVVFFISSFETCFWSVNVSKDLWGIDCGNLTNRRLEYGYKIGDSVFEQGHIIGEEEEDSRELLQSSFLQHTKNSEEQSETLGMEVQLEAF